ncbi:transposase [Streptomyces sp. NPDC057565]|uniref:IS110 family transposase n=1 Tax=Streptomyces sp. NPDC057565 TaxID=3346169 RepID=UPI0036A20544
MSHPGRRRRGGPARRGHPQGRSRRGCHHHARCRPGRRSFPATAQGYRQLIDWARSFGVVRRAGVECPGYYGAALARHLHAEGIEVTVVNQPDKAARRRHGKTDAVDAEATAQHHQAANAILTVSRAAAASRTA